MWLPKDRRILGLSLYHVRPVIDGFKLVFEDGSERQIPYSVERVPEGFLYSFTQPIVIRAMDKCRIEYHYSEPVEFLVNTEFVMENEDRAG